MASQRNRIGLLLIILGALMLGVVTPSRADDDEATRIYKLAQALYADNSKNSNYTSWINGDIGTDPSIKPEGLSAGKAIPDFKFSVFGKKSEKVASADLKPPYLLNFWASWCGPCRSEFPLITQTVADHKLTIPAIFVNINDTKADAELFLITYQTDLRILVDDRNAFSDQVKMAAIPQTVLVDADGKVQAIQSGEMSEIAMQFFVEIAAYPGIGAFDSAHPDKMPAAPPVATATVGTTAMEGK